MPQGGGPTRFFNLSAIPAKPDLLVGVWPDISDLSSMQSRRSEIQDFATWTAVIPAESTIVVVFERASPEAAEELTALTLASKAHWGYDAEFMNLARASLTVTAEYLEANECWVAEVDCAMVGWFSLVPVPDGLLLDNFFLLPAHIGSGLGRLMWDEAVRRAGAAGAGRLTLEADPNAAGFYERMGARRTGSVTAPDTGRELPIYEMRLTRDGG
jgi:GNAT superfamily N-acetyltransferase